MISVMISMVQNASDTVTRDVSVERVIRAIRNGGKTLRPKVETIRRTFSRVLSQTGDRKAAKRAIDSDKKKLPGVTCSGRFKERQNNALIEHSGLLGVDLDSLGDKLPEVRKKFETSPYVMAVFLSPSGDGLKVVFRVPPDASKHAGSFRAAEKHVRELTGIQIDQACKDMPRLCFMSYDPHLYVNDNAVEITPLPEPEKPKATPPNGAVNLSERQRIATELLGNIEWQSETSGYVVCPGKHLHTTGDGERDCKIDFDHVPTVHCFHDHCRGILDAINRELRSRIGKAEHQTPHSEAREEWQDPQPLPEDLPAVPPFNFDCLPDTLHPWIQDISERMQCPPDFPATGAMIALGSVVGRKIGIRPKRHDDWMEIPNLWGGIVGRPGLLKTPALQQALVPLRRLVARALEQYEQACRDHNISDMLRAQKKKLVEDEIKKHLKDNKEEDARKEAAKHVKEASDKPVCRRYEVNDSTIEKLGELLSENPNGLLLVRDELSGHLRTLDREDRAGDRAKHLEMWDGKGELTYDRIGRGTVRISSNTLSILGGIQPDVLIAYVRETVRGGTGNDGLLQRFQLFVWPDVPKHWRNVDRWPNAEAKNEAFALFEYLDGITAEAVGAVRPEEGIPFLRFTDDAQECFDVWRAELEKKTAQ
jgi:putative DNA primase/helicase